MNIISAQGEKNFTEMARRIFPVSGARSAAMERAAVAALKRANPHLSPDKPLEPGTPVFVPAIDRADAPSPKIDLLDETKRAATQLLDALHGVEKELEAAVQKKIESDASMLSALKKHSRELSEGGDDAAGRIKKIQATMKAEEKSAAEEAKGRRADFARLQKELGSFLEMH